MTKFYDAAACRRKANQHWEMAGLARMDNDKTDAIKHTQLAKAWDTLANNGGGILAKEFKA